MKKNIFKKIQLSYFLPFIILTLFYTVSSPYLLHLFGIEVNVTYKILRIIFLIALLFVSIYIAFKIIIKKHKKLKQENIELSASLKKIENKLKYNYIFYKHEPDDNYFVELSDSISTVLGFSKEDFVKFQNSKNYKLLTEGVFDRAKEYGSKGIIVPRYEVELYHKNGNILKFEISESSVFDEEGNLLSVEGTANLIKSANQILENKNVLFSEVYENFTDAVLIVKNGRFIEYNKKAGDLFGLTAEEIIMSSPFSNKFSPAIQPDGENSKEKAQKYMDLAFRKGEISFEWTHLKKGNTPFLAQVTLKKINIDNEILLIAKIVDLTNNDSANNQDAVLIKSKFNLFSNLVEQGYIVFNYLGEVVEYNNFIKERFPNLSVNRNIYELCNDTGFTDFIKSNITNKVKSNEIELKINGKSYKIKSEKFAGNLLMLVLNDKYENEKLTDIVKNSGAIIYMFDIENQKYEYISPSIYDVLGYTSEEFLSFTSIQLKELLHPEDLEKANTIFARLNSGKKTEATILYRIRRQDGKYLWVNDNYHLLKYEGKKYILGNVHDITKLIEDKNILSNNIKNLKKAIDNIENGIIIYENDSLIYLNETISEITGYSKEEFKQIKDITNLALPPEKERINKELENENLNALSFWIKHKSNRNILVNVKFLTTQINSNIITKYVIVTEIDIDNKKKSVLKNNEQILQNLLNLVKKKQLSKEQKEFLKILYDSPASINNLINAISQQNNIDKSSGLELFIKEIEKEIAKLVIEKDIDVTFINDFTEDIPLTFNTNKLKKTINDLLLFVLKFENNKLTVNTSIAKSNKNQIQIKINIKTDLDNFSEQDIDIINNLLSRTPVELNTVKKEYLIFSSISQNIHEIGGSISFLKGRGNKMLFSIRVNTKNIIKQETPINTSFNNINILLVEDNIFNQMVVKTMLLQYGCDIDVANTGKKALEMLKLKNYDLLLLDIILPDITGDIIIDTVRKDINNNKNIPIIIVTGDIYIDFKKYEKYDIKDVIIKPFTSRKLLSSIVLALSDDVINNNENIEEEYDKNIEQTINDLVNGNEELKEKLIKIFIEKYNKDIKCLEKETNSSNYEQIYKIAHGLKPSFSYMKLKNAEKTLYEIMENSKNKTPKINITRNIEQLKQEVEPIIHRLTKEIK